jgi:hypothetical protein
VVELNVLKYYIKDDRYTFNIVSLSVGSCIGQLKTDKNKIKVSSLKKMMNKSMFEVVKGRCPLNPALWVSARTLATPPC